LFEAATTINLPKHVDQAADHLISRFYGNLPEVQADPNELNEGLGLLALTEILLV